MSEQVPNEFSTVLEIDLEGVTAAAGLGWLREAGIYPGVITEARIYPANGDKPAKFYVYMGTEGINHRDSFQITEKGLKYLKKFLMDIGIPREKLVGKLKIDTGKLLGKVAHFSYTPPTFVLNEKNQSVPADGSYPRYTYMSADLYERQQQAIQRVQAAPIVTATEEAEDDSSFDFLND